MIATCTKDLESDQATLHLDIYATTYEIKYPKQSIFPFIIHFVFLVAFRTHIEIENSDPHLRLCLR